MCCCIGQHLFRGEVITHVSMQYGRILHECQGCIFMSPKDSLHECNNPYCKETSVIRAILSTTTMSVID